MQRTDYCDFEKLVSNDNAIQHQGDNRDGEGEGDDESIIVEFTKLDPTTDTLFLYAAVYEGGALRDVENVHIRMLSKRGGKQKVGTAEGARIGEREGEGGREAG